MFFNKKGSIEWSLTTIGGILIAALVGITLFTVVNAYLYPQTAESTILAKNIALSMDAIHTSPYDVNYRYPVSLQERNVDMEHNIVRVVAKEEISENKAERLDTFQNYFFYTTQEAVLPDKLLIDAAHILLTKQGNAYAVHDGSFLFDDSLVLSTGLKDVRIGIVVDSGNSGDAQVLNTIHQALTDQLRDKQIQLVSSHLATILIQLSFSDDDSHSIYYSNFNSDAVTLLATNVQSALQGLIDSSLGGSKTFPQTTQAHIDISFGLQHDQFGELRRDSSLQRTIGIALADAVKKTYPQAQLSLQ
ncbi:hypothetical protein K9M74_02485 [Candidatus Woesearchaeota archaeon]|nr:hypothetical protein [Candidatus Woesearchaeota archaeon]